MPTCEFLGDAYMLIGYGGKALIRGGDSHYPGGSVENFYAAGAIRNIATFHKNITVGNCENDTVHMGINSCRATILVRDACRAKKRITINGLLENNERLEWDLAGLKN